MGRGAQARKHGYGAHFVPPASAEDGQAAKPNTGFCEPVWATFIKEEEARLRAKGCVIA